MPRMAQNIKLIENDKEFLGWRKIQRNKQIKTTTKNAQDGAEYKIVAMNQQPYEIFEAMLTLHELCKQNYRPK